MGRLGESCQFLGEEHPHTVTVRNNLAALPVVHESAGWREKSASRFAQPPR
jgi:hypothetical protein